MDDDQRLTPPGPGSRFWLISSIRRVMEEVGKGISFSMAASVDQTDRFAINLDMGEIGALQVTSRKVLIKRFSDRSRLEAIAAAMRLQLNIVPVKQPELAPEQPATGKILILCENSDDLANAKQMKFKNPPLVVIAISAVQALTGGSPGIERIASALRDNKIVRCLLIAGSGDGPGPAVVAEWANLENAVQRSGVLDIVSLEPGNSLRMIKSNAARLAQLDLESAKTLVPRPPDEEPPDPDPW